MESTTKSREQTTRNLPRIGTLEQRDRPAAGQVEERVAPQILVDGRRLRSRIPYGIESRDMGGWREVIEPGALRGAQLDDLVATVDHAGLPIGRYPSTLELEDRSDGLHWSVEPPESRADVREAVERGDLRAGSWRMVVDRERWEGDVRHVEAISELRDVSIVTHPAYPEAAAELRSNGQQDGTYGPGGESTDPNGGGARRPAERAGGGLRVEDRHQGTGRGLAAAFQARGWPAERATLDWDEFQAECRALTVSADPDDVNQVRRQSAALGFDQRYAWPVFPQVGVGRDVTSVTVLKATLRELPVSGVVRDIDAVTEKAETDSTVDDVVTSLQQVASVQRGIPNIYLEQPAFRTVIEQDLRFALDGGLDELVLDAIAASDNQAPGSDPLLVSIRKAITVVEEAGYGPDTLILTPANAQALDTLVTGLSGGVNDYVFDAAKNAPRVIYGLKVRISKSIPAPAVVAASSFGKLYASPVSLDRFEADSGLTNRSNVRLELNAAFGIERQDAAVRIAAS